MRRALALAARARGRTAPNPMVGAVVVAGDRCVGQGFHPRAGAPHAEVHALRRAGEAARGATLFVTLEPCCHHGRTPPCTDAILAAGISRVVAAMVDPFPRVAGGGMARLREAGLPVECGLLAPEARTLNRGYLSVQERGLPWLTLKMAMTLDGRIATATGDSRWVTGETARAYVQRLRNWNDGVLIGIGTALADDPRLTVRLPRGRHPVRVVLDPRGRLPADSHLARTAAEIPTVLAVGENADTRGLEAQGVQVERFALRGGRLEPPVLLRRLAARGLHTVLCEGGAVLAGSLLDAGVVDELVWFVAPKLVGGAGAPGPVAGVGCRAMAAAQPLRSVRIRRFGADWGIFGYLRDP